MRSKCGNYAYALKLRSPEGVLYYLGQLARLEEQQGRALLIHVCDFGQSCGLKDEPPLLPLFVALQERPGCSRGIIQVQSFDNKNYLIPSGTVSQDVTPSLDEDFQDLKLTHTGKLCSPGRSMMALGMAAQLIGLQKTAKDFSTTTTVKLVGQ
jgi:hypothetical protein